MLGGVSDQLESDFDLAGNVFAANLVLTQAESSALFGALGALTPAHWANAVSFMLARCVAEGAALLLLRVADQSCASRAAV